MLFSFSFLHVFFQLIHTSLMKILRISISNWPFVLWGWLSHYTALTSLCTIYCDRCVHAKHLSSICLPELWVITVTEELAGNGKVFHPTILFGLMDCTCMTWVPLLFCVYSILCLMLYRSICLLFYCYVFVSITTINYPNVKLNME